MNDTYQKKMIKGGDNSDTRVQGNGN